MLTTQSIIAESRRARQLFSSHLMEGCWRGYRQPSRHRSDDPQRLARRTREPNTWQPPQLLRHGPPAGTARPPRQLCLVLDLPPRPMGEDRSCTSRGGTFPVPGLLSCRCAGTQPLGGQRVTGQAVQTNDHTNAAATLLPRHGEQVRTRKVTTTYRGPHARMF